jgi:hypothetical protein
MDAALITSVRIVVTDGERSCHSENGDRSRGRPSPLVEAEEGESVKVKKWLRRWLVSGKEPALID